MAKTVLDIPVFRYKPTDFIYTIKNDTIESKLDIVLREKWKNAEENGTLRYKLNIREWKRLEGSCRFLAQVCYYSLFIYYLFICYYFLVFIFFYGSGMVFGIIISTNNTISYYIECQEPKGRITRLQAYEIRPFIFLAVNVCFNNSFAITSL